MNAEFSTRGRIRQRVLILTLACSVVPQACKPSELSETATQIQSPIQLQFAELASNAEQLKKPVIGAGSGWLFLTADVRFASLGPFWGESAASVSRARKPEHADPLAAIVDFHQQLDSLGIELWVVPVPPKAAVDLPGLLKESRDEPVRCDGAVGEFLRLLEQHNIQVVDLEPEFRKVRKVGELQLDCRLDSHWSGEGIALAGRVIASELKKRPWRSEGLDASGKREQTPRLTRAKLPVKVRSDLPALEKLAAPGFRESDSKTEETIDAWFVTDRQSGNPIKPSTDGRVLLLGDSHTLFQHDPTLHATGAGLSDQLMYELNEPVDLIGVRGSGSTSARVTLARQRDRLRGKRAVVWCFAAREFTESTDGWRKLQIARP